MELPSLVVLVVRRKLTDEQAQKFGHINDQESDDELGEHSVLLESPLDKVEPYQTFRASLMCMLPLFLFYFFEL